MAETVMTVVLIGVVLLLVGLGGYAIYRLWNRARPAGSSEADDRHD